ncbi:NAD(P)H-hydrate dehydratase [Candidatus Kirkpatrickella diaphorinae]|uniref:Bifunctional NAD(P)H-hydrate repair enzyme n=1 Tax=Candidatus Kirkpatrickella diaphorinae TaxID=2984322 RepID=A0ABY6GLR7_9PROT|nr:NAD(P)H-hydrate dehydratase [Candidatus Kirkpatrickella diaphorinae]UYH51733.1 NAD(P)H-hydrate dehydratase [Candidatus Kirkpatrickella diaphorinae]
MTLPHQFIQRAVLTPAEFAALDAAAARTIGMETLIARAGWCVAREVRSRFAPSRVLILCGPGNNGRDGQETARNLARAGWDVDVAFYPDTPQSPPEWLARAGVTMVPFTVEEASRADLVIDAVFGAGLNRPADAAVISVLRAARRRVAIDVPSGVDGATGHLPDDAPEYDLSVTFVRLKPAHLLAPARFMMGEILCCDIGMDDALVAQYAGQMFHNGPELWDVPTMSLTGHKYDRGIVSIIGGAVMPGATRLAVDGARRSGAGLVRIAAGPSAPLYHVVAPADVIVDAAPLETLLDDARRKCWICGPGLTEDEVGASFDILVGAGRQIVADAGALAWAGSAPEKLRGATIITPHMGEFARLFGGKPRDLIAAARRVAVSTGAVVILKGASTVIAAPDGRIAINTHASPKLATAGSGDTLSGVIATLLACGMAPWEAGCAAVWIHGEAGCRAGPWPPAVELAQHLGAARESAERRL